jgi:hypothetical protein
MQNLLFDALSCSIYILYIYLSCFFSIFSLLLSASSHWVSECLLHFLLQVQACPVGTVDIEASEKDAVPHSVRVYSGLNRTENLLSASLTLPFHIRYHRPVPHGGYSKVQLGAPSLLLHCQNGMQCVQGERIHVPCMPCSQELCQWINLAYKTVSEIEIIVFRPSKADQVVMSQICIWGAWLKSVRSPTTLVSTLFFHTDTGILT